jgi:homoserine kinase
VVPDYALPTKQARQVLPAQLSRADAVHNLQRAAVLTAQLFSGKADFHRSWFDDRWHQPCRTPLVPGLKAALELKHPDLMGICLSGAGPSILAFARANCGTVGKLIKDTLAREEVRSEVHVLTADNQGAKGWSLPV